MVQHQTSSTDRAVYFQSDADEIFLVESMIDFTEEEIEQSWYTAEEMMAMKVQCYREAAELESSSMEENVKPKRRSSSRGLEGWTDQGNESRVDAVRTCIDAVMDEQDSQWKNDCDDFDRLALASQQVTGHCILVAIQRAKKDAKLARKIYRMEHQKKQVTPPILPKRKLSTEDLVCFARDKFSFVQKDLLTLMLERRRKRGNNDDILLQVDLLGTCKRVRNESNQMGYSKIPTFSRTKVA